MLRGMNSSGKDSAMSVRKTPRGCAPGCVAWVFALMFLGGGCGMFYLLALRPGLGMLQARNWVATPCTVVSSGVEADDGSLQLTVVFKYSVDQKEYQSDTYCFTSMSSNTANRWKQQVVKDHPAGKQTTCYVNPSNPAEAVIEPGWVPDMWWGLFPFPFLLVGGAALLVATGVIRLPNSTLRPSASNWKPTPQVRALPREPEDSDSEAEDTDATELADGPVTLKPASTPLGVCLGVLIGALFWNGIVSVFVWQVYRQFQQGQVGGWGWFEAVFLVPFVLIGLGLIAAFFYSLLNLFNPRPTLIVNSQSVPLGGELQIRWTVAGRIASINRFTITLKGVEKAIYHRGTTTHTDEATFAEILLIETFENFEIAEGETTAAIPADTMHSFDAGHNKIEWTLVVKGDIQLWPDMSVTFPITVLPKLAKEST